MQTGSFGIPAALREAKQSVRRLEQVYRLISELEAVQEPIGGSAPPLIFDPSVLDSVAGGLAQLRHAAEEPVNRYLRDHYGFGLGDRIEIETPATPSFPGEQPQRMLVTQVRSKVKNRGFYLRGVALKSDGSPSKQTATYSLEGPGTCVRVLP